MQVFAHGGICVSDGEGAVWNYGVKTCRDLDRGETVDDVLAEFFEYDFGDESGSIVASAALHNLRAAPPGDRGVVRAEPLMRGLGHTSRAHLRVPVERVEMREELADANERLLPAV